MDSNQIVDLPGEVAQVTRIALDAVLFDPATLKRFVGTFVEAGGASMARPERIEDVDPFAELAVGRILNDPELHATLHTLVARGLRAYMEPK